MARNILLSTKSLLNKPDSYLFRTISFLTYSSESKKNCSTSVLYKPKTVKGNFENNCDRRIFQAPRSFIGGFVTFLPLANSCAWVLRFMGQWERKQYEDGPTDHLNPHFESRNPRYFTWSRIVLASLFTRFISFVFNSTILCKREISALQAIQIKDNIS